MIEEIRLTILVENSATVENPHLTAKHGLALLLEAKDSKSRIVTVMVDTGPSPDVTLHNIEKLNIDLEKVDAITLSHGHYDHTGGLVEIIKMMKTPLVIAHPEICNPKFAYRPSLKYVGTPFKLIDVEEAGGLPLLSRNPVLLAEGIVTTGEIERTTEFEMVEGFKTVEANMFKDDVMIDEQALVINLGDKGLVVISGCSHSGIINIVKYSQKIIGEKSVYAIIGGFHLTGAKDEKIQKTIDELLKFEPRWVMPCHCTGAKAIQKFENTFGEKCSHPRTGDIVKL